MISTVPGSAAFGGTTDPICSIRDFLILTLIDRVARTRLRRGHPDTHTSARERRTTGRRLVLSLNDALSASLPLTKQRLFDRADELFHLRPHLPSPGTIRPSLWGRGASADQLRRWSSTLSPSTNPTLNILFVPQRQGRRLRIGDRPSVLDVGRN